MKLWIWFDHEKGPYYVEDGGFNSIDDAEEFWRDDPFFISAEPVGAEPPVAKEYSRMVSEIYGYPTR